MLLHFNSFFLCVVFFTSFGNLSALPLRGFQKVVAAAKPHRLPLFNSLKIYSHCFILHYALAVKSEKDVSVTEASFSFVGTA